MMTGKVANTGERIERKVGPPRASRDRRSEGGAIVTDTYACPPGAAGVYGADARPQVRAEFDPYEVDRGARRRRRSNSAAPPDGRGAAVLCQQHWWLGRGVRGAGHVTSTRVTGSR